MALLPRTPDGWLSGDQTNDIGFDVPDDNPVAGNFNGARGILSATGSDLIPSSGLNLLLEPHEIESIPGLPDHVYQNLRGHPAQSGQSEDSSPSGAGAAAIYSAADEHNPGTAPVRVAEATWFRSPPAVGPRMEHKLPPEYVPENGYDAFGRALANGVTFNAADGIAAMGDATIPLNPRASRAPTWAERAQENADVQYRTSVADRYYHPVATAAGDAAAFLVNPGGALFPSKSLAGAAITGAIMGGAKQVGENLRTRNSDITHDVLVKAGLGAASRTGFYLAGKGRGR